MSLINNQPAAAYQEKKVKNLQVLYCSKDITSEMLFAFMEDAFEITDANKKILGSALLLSLGASLRNAFHTTDNKSVGFLPITNNPKSIVWPVREWVLNNTPSFVVFPKGTRLLVVANNAMPWTKAEKEFLLYRLHCSYFVEQDATSADLAFLERKRLRSY